MFYYTSQDHQFGVQTTNEAPYIPTSEEGGFTAIFGKEHGLTLKRISFSSEQMKLRFDYRFSLAIIKFNNYFTYSRSKNVFNLAKECYTFLNIPVSDALFDPGCRDPSVFQIIIKFMPRYRIRNIRAYLSDAEGRQDDDSAPDQSAVQYPCRFQLKFCIGIFLSSQKR